MTLGAPEYMLAFMLVPFGMLLMIWQNKRRRQAIERFADSNLLPLIAPALSDIYRRRSNNLSLIGWTILFLVCALIRPQIGYQWQEGSRVGIDIAIAIDTSASMLAEDVKPNRFERAKREIIDLLPKLTGDRVGLVSFAGTAHIELPLTLDYETFELFLSQTLIVDSPVQGTNIELAILKSINLHEQHSGDINSVPGGKKKAILLLTDGESFDGDLSQISSLAEQRGVLLFIIGIGSEDGAPIPLESGYKRDSSGSIVVSKLSETALRKLALETGGVYVSSIVGDRDLQLIYDQGIKERIAVSEFAGGKAKIWNEYFQLPLAIALLFYLIFLWRRYKAGSREIDPAPAIASPIREPVSLIILLTFSILLPQRAMAQPAEYHGLQGAKAYKSAEFEKALESFIEARKSNPDDYRYALGQGSTLYRLEKYEDAKAAFLESSQLTDNPARKSEAFYNAGNSFVQLYQFEDAIEYYNKALELTPEDSDIQKNLAFAKKMLEQKPPEESDKDSKEENSKKSDSKDSDQSESDSQQNKEESDSGSGDKDENSQAENDAEENESENEEKEESEGETSNSEGGGKSTKGKEMPPEQESESESEGEGSSGGQPNSSQEDKEKESKEELDSAFNQANKEKEKEKEESEGDSKNQGNTGAGASSNNTGPSDSHGLTPLSALDGLEESEDARRTLKRRQAIREIREMRLPRPTKDW